MYAVYGLNEERNKTIEFLGYVPANFFDHFTDPSVWSVEFIDMHDDGVKMGRMCGRAFFIDAHHLRASKDQIRDYMGPEATASCND